MTTVTVYRILGNDLWPRHGLGQTLAAVRFVLRHEPALEGCERRWILNRIASRRRERRLIELLTAAGEPFLRLPFDVEEYAAAAARTGPPPRYPLADELATAGALTHHHKMLYGMNVNGARNAALRDGRGRAEWVAPLDGSCVFDRPGWEALRAAVRSGDRSAYAVPLYRLDEERDYFDFDPAGQVADEPQVLLRSDAGVEFSEGYRYGRLNKVELLERLDLVQPGSLLARDGARAGYVLRLPARPSRLVRAETADDRVALRRRAARLHLLRLDLLRLGPLGLLRERLARRLRRAWGPPP